MRHRELKRASLALAAALVLVASLGGSAAAEPVLVADLPNGQPAGTTVTWTLTGEDTGTEIYQLRVGPVDDLSKLRVMYDYRDDNVFDWTPIDEGTYVIVGVVRDLATGATNQTAGFFKILPSTPAARIQPVVSETENPLVALYGAPECSTGLRMRVRFFAPPDGVVSRTHAKECRAGRTMNFYVGGMRWETLYVLQYEIMDASGNVLATADPRVFESQPAPTGPPLAVPTLPYDARASTVERVILQSPLYPGNEELGIQPFTHAIDLDGEIIWFAPEHTIGELLMRPGGNGTFYAVGDERLVQRDLHSNVVRETTTVRLSEQLTAAGLDPINNIHHEARPLPDGRLALLATVEKLLEDLQGPGLVDVLGDMVVVLDKNLQVVWTWNAFDHLDVARKAILDEKCPAFEQMGCPPVHLISEPELANDWTHSNTVTYSPSDGNLLVSVRHQDWVIKIDYRDGAGDGHVIWRLGPDGDFALSPSDPDGWFSHTHDPNFVSANQLVVYDNSNTRCSAQPGCQSRGQIYQLDEGNLVATLILNADLGEYSIAVGSAQPLSNGNTYFDSGVPAGMGVPLSYKREFLPDGSLICEIESPISTYRSHRMIDLYTLPPIWGVGEEAS